MVSHTTQQWLKSINTMRPRQNGHLLADDTFKCIFLNENAWIPIKISLKFVPKGPINNIPALVQIMAWRRPGDKPLSEPMMAHLPMHIWVTRPQWVNSSLPGQNGCHFTDDIFKWILINKKFCILIWISLKFVPKGPIDNKSALIKVMAWWWIGNKSLPEPILAQSTDMYAVHVLGEMSSLEFELTKHTSYPTSQVSYGCQWWQVGRKLTSLLHCIYV